VRLLQMRRQMMRWLAVGLVEPGEYPAKVLSRRMVLVHEDRPRIVCELS